jgi:hypothetical protein
MQQSLLEMINMAISDVKKQEILEAAKKWFREIIAINHAKNTKKLKDPQQFDINPFTVAYLAKYLTGNISPQSISQALLYPRVLGTSFTTSFGTNLQKFIPYLKDVLGNEVTGSVTAGMDIEFIDQIDKQKKYCQLKSGLKTINKDDVTTIHNHFRDARNLARANGVNLSADNMVIGVLYGERKKLGGSYKKLEKEHGYHVFVGQEFWLRLTGDEDFYFELGQAIASVAVEFEGHKLLEDTVGELSKTEVIKKLAGSE